MSTTKTMNSRNTNPQLTPEQLDLLVEASENDAACSAARSVIQESIREILGQRLGVNAAPSYGAVLRMLMGPILDGAPDVAAITDTLRREADDIDRRRDEAAGRALSIQRLMAERRVELHALDDVRSVLTRALRHEVARLRAAVEKAERPERVNVSEMIAAGFDPEQAAAAMRIDRINTHAQRLEDARRMLGLPADAPLELPTEAELIEQRRSKAERLQPVVQALEAQRRDPLRRRPAELPEWVDVVLASITKHTIEVDVLHMVPHDA